MTPKEFLKSKNIPEPTYNGVRLVDNEMEAYKITDLLHEYAIEVITQAKGAEQSDSNCNLDIVMPSLPTDIQIEEEAKCRQLDGAEPYSFAAGARWIKMKFAQLH